MMSSGPNARCCSSPTDIIIHTTDSSNSSNIIMVERKATPELIDLVESDEMDDHQEQGPNGDEGESRQPSFPKSEQHEPLDDHETSRSSDSPIDYSTSAKRTVESIQRMDVEDEENMGDDLGDTESYGAPIDLRTNSRLNNFPVSEKSGHESIAEVENLPLDGPSSEGEETNNVPSEGSVLEASSRPRPSSSKRSDDRIPLDESKSAGDEQATRRPYFCKMCDDEFETKKLLREHIIKYHKIKKSWLAKYWNEESSDDSSGTPNDAPSDQPKPRMRHEKCKKPPSPSDEADSTDENSSDDETDRRQRKASKQTKRLGRKDQHNSKIPQEKRKKPLSPSDKADSTDNSSDDESDRRQERALKQTKRTGRKGKSCQCYRCGRYYKFQYTLNRHLDYECGVRPSYHCPKCEYAANRKSILKVHLKGIHKLNGKHLDGMLSLISPCECANCGKTFKSKNCMRMHMRDAHNDYSM